MKDHGCIKSGSQMQIKFKHLKEMYLKCKRNNSVSGASRMTFPYYEAMEELLGGRPTAQSVDGLIGIDSSSQETIRRK